MSLDPLPVGPQTFLQMLSVDPHVTYPKDITCNLTDARYRGMKQKALHQLMGLLWLLK